MAKITPWIDLHTVKADSIAKAEFSRLLPQRRLKRTFPQESKRYLRNACAHARHRVKKQVNSLFANKTACGNKIWTRTRIRIAAEPRKAPNSLDIQRVIDANELLPRNREIFSQFLLHSAGETDDGISMFVEPAIKSSPPPRMSGHLAKVNAESRGLADQYSERTGQ